MPKQTKSKPKVTVVGSFMMDLVVKAERRPAKGETLVGQEFGMFCGGKGANQAVAAARCCADVTMVGRVGDDIFGDKFFDALKSEGVETKYIIRDKKNGTGIGTPVIDAHGDNSIIIIPRANTKMTPSDVEKAKDAIEKANVLILQLEIPLDASEKAAEIARSKGVKVILNPAPARKLPESILKKVDILTPNETEAQMLTGISVVNDDGAKKAAKKLLDMGVKDVIITLGGRGAMWASKAGYKIIPAFKVEKIIDTTAAGDAFIGGLSVAFAEGKSMEDAIKFANACGGLAVTVMGAMPSLPKRERVEKTMCTGKCE
jgi:ribokinase